jgi:hypothetical protein
MIYITRFLVGRKCCGHVLLLLLCPDERNSRIAADVVVVLLRPFFHVLIVGIACVSSSKLQAPRKDDAVEMKR